MSIHDQLSPVLSDLAGVLDGIGADQLSQPTPCSEYDVTALRAHTLQWLTSFTEGLSDPAGNCPIEEVDVVGSGGDQVRSLAERMRATEGAEPEQLVIGGDGLPTSMGLSMILGEYLVHGWDLAVATGQTWQPDSAACADAAAFMGEMLSPEMRGQSFASAVEVPADAPALDQLVAITGRDPQWSAQQSR